jgi:hypothetical protein
VAYDEPDAIDQAAEDASVRRSYIALAFVALIVIAGVWLVNSFREHNRTIECFEQGRHDCVPLEKELQPPPR